MGYYSYTMPRHSKESSSRKKREKSSKDKSSRKKRSKRSRKHKEEKQPVVVEEKQPVVVVEEKQPVVVVEEKKPVVVVEEKQPVVVEETSDESTPLENLELQLAPMREKTDLLLSTLLNEFQTLQKSLKELSTKLKEVQRQVGKERKETRKVSNKYFKTNKKKKRSGNKSPGGFTKPAPLSEPMCQFLGEEVGTEMPRIDVTRRINLYVKENKLQNPDNKREIVADNKLRELLYLTNNDTLTYFNLQRFMKVHFLKRTESGEVVPFTPPSVTV